MIKEIAEPMFKTMLPGPLASLHFTKLDLGHVPLELSNLLVTKTETDGIKLDLNVDWAGKCDIALDASMIPTVIGAAQIAFVNPPVLKLDFTGAANVADSDMIDGAVRSVIMSIINSMLVLPNRLMIKLDATSDYFKTQIYPLGILRLTVEKASGFAEEKQSASKRFLSKITRASPDTYCNVIDLMDHDVGSDDQIGLAVTTVKDILLTGAGVLGIPGRREELNPSVVVTWGEKHRFQTAMKTDAPGTDISNPSFDQSFRIPYSADMVSGGGQSFRIALMNKKDEVGSIDIPLSDVLSAPDMIVQNNFGVGGGAAVRASISLRGLTAADI
ncbi:putative Extended synaptotagmin-2 [Glarea lozoyensis 74030]|uniref:Putative Extended synaptotagmin-2 n=1 Tax=Glarea lozoyensis (strain ATCC 74030 / MF5533) TaxID=1104152 RepID=H0EKH5_GLAL7|nr:putative Extended synaptotagmin-2 [Glarea lozoyensis 74030]